MKREMDMIRDILLEIREAPALVSYDVPDGPGAEEAFARLHQVKLLIKAGYLEGEFHCDRHGRCFSATGLDLTWAGHDLRDNLANETVWAKTKEKLKDLAGNATADVLKELSTGVILNMLR